MGIARARIMVLPFAGNPDSFVLDSRGTDADDAKDRAA